MCVSVSACAAYESIHTRRKAWEGGGGGVRLTSCRPGDGAADGTGGGPQEGGRKHHGEGERATRLQNSKSHTSIVWDFKKVFNLFGAATHFLYSTNDQKND